MKKLLALVLMMLLVFSSFPITAFASEPDEADIPLETEENTGIPLEMEEIDPSTLHVKKLGELESEETPEIEEMTHKPGDIVRVSIFLDGDSVADAGYSLDGIADSDDVDAYRDELKKVQDAVQRRIESTLGKDLDVKWNLTLLTNVISAEVLFSDIVRIEHVKGVKSVYIENQYSAEEASETDGTKTGHTYRDMVGAADTWAEGYTGAGSLIAIIDTGIDTTHQSFRSSDFEYSLSTLASQPDLLTKNEVNAVKSKLNGKGGSYVNTKIPFGYNYVDKNTTIDHLSDTQGEHGSHVAGIAAANRYLYSNNQYTEAARLYLAVGMAPDAQLLIMKIFGASGGAYDSDYIAAIEDAIVLGADAINLSLGSVEPGFTFIPGYQDVFNDLSNNKYNSKAVLSVSAGNSRSFATHTSSGKLYAEDVSMNTLGAPASYINSLSVASADNIYKSGSNPIAREDAVISDFSSWGIPGSLLLKPEITAPGGNIRSVYGTNVTAKGTIAGGPDQYETLSGTSMASPHIAGTSALLAQYVKKKDLSVHNRELEENYSQRAISQSLLMSTATPMKNKGKYISILQQGAGLVEVSKAVKASSVIMMESIDDTLTAKTGAAADGKIKAELGDDPNRTGIFEYSFTVYNLEDLDLHFDLSTDIFTQEAMPQTQHYAEGPQIIYRMNTTTKDIEADITYTWEDIGYQGEEYDVNLDGKTNSADAQALLDYLSGIQDGNTLDLYTGDIDQDGKISSKDAHLLLDHVNNGSNFNDGLVLANSQRKVTVTICLKNTEETESVYTNGFYVEGFTYVKCNDIDEVGKTYAHEHSIPILGFYGSWTDPGMFDTTSPQSALYGNRRYLYSTYGVPDKVPDTNYMTLSVDGSSYYVTGNPYTVEEVFPADRLAVKSSTVIDSVRYTLIRSAGTTGFIVGKLDRPAGSIYEYVTASIDGVNVNGMFYNNNLGYWVSRRPMTYVFGKNVTELGFSEGDSLRVGYYAIPEYYAMLFNESDIFDETSGSLDLEGFKSVIKNDLLGPGAGIAYDFTIDDTAPVIESATLNGTTLTVNIDENIGIAYLAVMSLDGYDIFNETVPEKGAISIDFDISDAIERSPGYVVIFTGDYAGNETAVMTKISDSSTLTKDVFIRVDSPDEIVEGDEYILVDSNVAGSTNLCNPPTEKNIKAYGNLVKSRIRCGVAATDDRPYIDVHDFPSTAVMTAERRDGGWAFRIGNNYLTYTTSAEVTYQLIIGSEAQIWNVGPECDCFYFIGNNGYQGYAYIYKGYHWRYGGAFSNAYLYRKQSVEIAASPGIPVEVHIDPNALTIYKGNEYQLIEEVLPVTLENKSVSWYSSDPSVVTVDQSGIIKGISEGTASVFAVSDVDPSQRGECKVTVIAKHRELNGIVWDSDGSRYFSQFNVGKLPEWERLHDDPVEAALFSAYMNDSENLYAFGLNEDNLMTEMYTVGRTDHSITYVGPLFYSTNAVTRGYQNYYGSGGLIYAIQDKVIVGNSAVKTVDFADGTSFTGVGIPYGILDFGDSLDGTMIVALTPERVFGSSASTYFALDEDGSIYRFSLSTKYGGGWSSSGLTTVFKTGIKTSPLFQSLYYDGTDLYWSHWEDDKTTLYIIDLSANAVYDAGDFGEGVWPVTGLYIDGLVDPKDANSTSYETEGFETIESDLRPIVSSRNELPDDLPAEAAPFGYLNSLHYHAVDAEMTVSNEEVFDLVPEAVIIDAEPDMAVVDTKADATDIDAVPGADGTVSVSIKEDENVTNGFVKMTYDPDILKLSTYESDLLYRSVNTSVPGEIVFVYASENTIDAGTELLNVSFKAICEDSSVYSLTVERNDELSLAERKDTEIPGLGHDWQPVTYTWSAGNGSCTALKACARDHSHDISETAVATSVLTPPTDTQDGSIVYTAVFENEEFETQVKTALIPAGGINVIAVTEETLEDSYTVNGRTVRVSYDLPCKVGYLSDGAYVPIPAESNGDGTYNFTAPEGVYEVVLVIMGDADLSGEFDFFDVITAKAMDLYPEGGYDPVQLFAADVDLDEEFGFFDVILIKAADLGKTDLEWQ